MRRLFQVVLLAIVFAAVPALADEPSTDAVTMLEPVVVVGSVPGPGLWQVQAENGHVLWVFGTLSPLPRDIDWEADEAKARLASASMLLLPPGMTVKAKGGFFSTLGLLPKLIGMRKDPEKERLAELLPPELLARWQRLKALYMPRNRKVEKFRPFFAGWELYSAAVDAAGLQNRDAASKVLRRYAKKKKVPLQSSSFALTLDEPKQALAEFRATRMDDTACFAEVLDLIEFRLPQVQQMANAWAMGDVDTLAEHYRQRWVMACADAISGADFAHSQGLDDIPAKIRESWLEAAEKTLAEHETGFALLPMGNILGQESFLDTLQARGYTIVPPESDGED